MHPYMKSIHMICKEEETMRTMKRLLIFTVLLVMGVTFTAHSQDDLTQTFTASDSSYTLDYPQGWVITELENRGVAILGSPDASIVISVFAPLAMSSTFQLDE